MSAVTTWSRTAANNNSAAPNGAPEGWAPSAVNDTIRELMKAVVDEATNGAAKVLASVAGTNTITASATPDITAYSAGMTLSFTPANTNTAAATINIDSLGALDILRYGGESLQAGDLVAGTPAYLILDSGADDFILLNPQNTGFRNLPQNLQTGASYTLVISDAGKHINCNGSSMTVTIPANASVAFPIGTAVTFLGNNSNSTSTTIAITTDTLYLAGTGWATTGSRTLAYGGIATAVKVGNTSWMISGTGLS